MMFQERTEKGIFSKCQNVNHNIRRQGPCRNSPFDALFLESRSNYNDGASVGLTKQHIIPTQSNNNMSNSNQSILIIGATAGTGQEVLKQLLTRTPRPKVHLFCRNPSKISHEHVRACDSIQQGDARESNDLARALTKTKATHVIVSIGNGADVSKSDIRTASAQALARALQTTTGLENVQVIVVSSTGAGTSEIKVGMGIGKLIEYHLRHILADHTGQEAAFLESGLADRTWIVRATALKDDQPTGKVATFGDKEKGPTVHIDRADVAMYIADGICNGSGDVGGRIDNITTAKDVKQ